MKWSNGDDNTRWGPVYQKLISAEINSGLNTTNWQESISPYENQQSSSSPRMFVASQDSLLPTISSIPAESRGWIIN
jgi:hypothetical protein